MKKIAIIYGELCRGVQKKAVEVLSQLLLDYTVEYPACFPCEAAPTEGDFLRIYIGTKGNNPYISENSETTLSHEEEYAIRVKNGTVLIEGYDDAGVLYGCMDFYNRYLIKCEYPHTDKYRVNCFERDLPDYSYSSYPSVKSRGIWTWGHVIYDFRDFLDNMVKLKMNTLIVWNDFPPVNARELVAYAHDCGIKVIWGFPWLWDTNCRVIDLAHMEDHSEEIFRRYEREYEGIGGDGIYFQTATEMNIETLNGIVVADAVTSFVNKTAGLFFDKYPDLELQFGLHATSVKSKLDYIEKVDPRIRIVWENCGAFPFAYIPNAVADFDETCDFVERIAKLRGEDDRFGAVTKGLTKLDWSAFRHMDGAAFVGTSSKTMKRDRVVRKSKIWRYIQAYWLIRADKALEMVRLMSRAKDRDLVVTALVEDGMFEENIMYPVALYSEMLWDCDADIDTLLSQVALRDYVDFA